MSVFNMAANSLHSFGQTPSLHSFGQAPSLHSFGQAPSLHSFGQAPSLHSFGQAPSLHSFGQAPSLHSFGQAPSLHSVESTVDVDFKGHAQGESEGLISQGHVVLPSQGQSSQINGGIGVDTLDMVVFSSPLLFNLRCVERTR
jgi:hypothetical protein